MFITVLIIELENKLEEAYSYETYVNSVQCHTK